MMKGIYLNGMINDFAATLLLYMPFIFYKDIATTLQFGCFKTNVL